ncbi:MAG: class I SAM-dependent methyltransferase [Candidatus Krumholzibacteriota bacterium]|nr:class I SAM-dependent methyltransferase [Candidatus Krumholzibacteriota bacterium]
MDRDSENPTYIHTTETLWSESGKKYQFEKYRPKIEFLKSHFGGRFSDIRILDVGVGYGVFLHFLEKEYGLNRLFGMDPFPRSIEIAKNYSSAEIYKGDIRDEPWPVGSGLFDVISSFDVVEHLEDPGGFFRKAGKYLADGGLIIVTTPNKSFPYRMRSVPGFGIRDTNPTHINVNPPRYWKRLARENGFEIVKAWKGEHLAHTRIFPRLFRNLCGVLGLDHRKIPLINSFEQSFCMVLSAGSLPSAGNKPER